MICLDNTDTLEGGASVANVVDYTVHGLVGSTFTNIAQGQLSDTDPSVLYTAAAGISIVSVVFVNTHSSAVTVNLYLDPANAGTPRRMIPKNLSLAVGYSLHFDGQRCTIIDTNGGIVSGLNVSDTAYGVGWNGVTTIAPSKNAVYDEMELRAPKASPTFTGDVTLAGNAVNATLPAFLATNTLQSNVSGDGTEYSVVFATEVFDQGSDFDGTSTFTAPVTGRYFLSAMVEASGLTADHNALVLKLVTSNRTYIAYGYGTAVGVNPFTFFAGNMAMLVDMDVSDTAYVTLIVYNGTKVVDIAAGRAFFSGHLVC